MIDCKQYIVLAGLNYHPRCWGEQYSGEFDTIEEAQGWLHLLVEGYAFYYDWYEVIDLNTKRVVFSSNTDWDNIQPTPKPRMRLVGAINEIK